MRRECLATVISFSKPFPTRFTDRKTKELQQIEIIYLWNFQKGHRLEIPSRGPRPSEQFVMGAMVEILTEFSSFPLDRVAVEFRRKLHKLDEVICTENFLFL